MSWLEGVHSIMYLHRKNSNTVNSIIYTYIYHCQRDRNTANKSIAIMRLVSLSLLPYVYHLTYWSLLQPCTHTCPHYTCHLLQYGHTHKVLYACLSTCIYSECHIHRDMQVMPPLVWVITIESVCGCISVLVCLLMPWVGLYAYIAKYGQVWVRRYCCIKHCQVWSVMGR